MRIGFNGLRGGQMKMRSRSLVFAVASMLIAFLWLGQLPANAMDTGALGQAFDTLHWVAYSPLNYNPNIGKQAARDSIKADLEVLKANGFGGIVTYGCDGCLEDLVPEVASGLGLKMIVGVWDPKNQSQLDSAVKIARRPNVASDLRWQRGTDRQT